MGDRPRQRGSSLTLKPVSSSPTDTATQDTPARKRKMVAEWVERPASRFFNEEHLPTTPGPSNRSAGDLDEHYSRPMSPSSEDYNTWEAGLSLEGIREMQQELGNSGTL